MHDIQFIRQSPERFDAGLKRRGLPARSPEILALDQRWREARRTLEAAQARRNEASKLIGQAKAKKDEAGAQALMTEVAGLKEKIASGEGDSKAMEMELDRLLAEIPNLPAEDVPDGKDEHGNAEVRRHGQPRALNFPPKEHFDLGEALGLMDFEVAARMSGARFVVLKKDLARLERALGNFMLDLHTRQFGYSEVSPPLLVRDEAMYGTGQLPKFREDLFATKIEETIWPDEFEVKRVVDGRLTIAFRGERREQLERAYHANNNEFVKVYLTGERPPEGADILATFQAALRPIVETNRWLIPTAEVSLTNLVREQILAEDALPLRYTACTPCFRAEAGAAGKDTRGMIRMHQFSKVELVSITTPEQSLAEHERMTGAAEEVLKRLGLHFRTMALCTGDMGFSAKKTYDIEVWLPGQNRFREISSCSNCGDFQARRLQARFRAAGDAKGTRFVHTLNGSGLAVGRTLVAVLETYQQADGSIAIPEALQPFMGGQTTISA